MSKTIYEQLAPLVRERGVKDTAQRAGIDQGQLSNWLNRKASVPGGPPRQFPESRLEALAEAVGVEIVIRPLKRQKRHQAP